MIRRLRRCLLLCLLVPDDVARILSLVPLDSYISRFITLKKKGRNYLGLCPFHHEKTPSFTVSPEKGIFKCFGCGKGGNLFTFVQEYEGLDFYGALKLVAEQTGVQLNYRHSGRSRNLKNEKDNLQSVAEWVGGMYRTQITNEAPQAYLSKRKIKPKIQKIFSLGFAPPRYQFLESNLQKKFASKEYDENLIKLNKLGLIVKDTRGDGDSFNQFHGRLIFPIHSEQGHLIGFGGRSLADKSNVAKYINSTDSKLFHKKHSLYNLHRAKDAMRENNMVVLVEGYFDVIGLYQKDIKNVVAPLGTAFTNEQAKLIRRFTNHIVIFFDSDNAGKEAAFKALLVAQKNKIQVKVVQYFENLTDPFDISIEKDEIDILGIIDSAQDEVAFVLWYYFFNKYSIADMEEKKKAIAVFFSYLQENILQLWEQLEFLKKAAYNLEVSYEVLAYDFKKFLKGSQEIRLFPNKPQVKQTNPEPKIPKNEKDILAVLLYSPENWSNELLLEQINWTTQEMYLLFSYFQDRLKIGELWEWNKIGEIVLDLPKELSPLLAEVIMEFDQVLENTPEDKDYSSALKKMILQKKVSEIDSAMKNIQKQMNLETQAEDPSFDELAETFQSLIANKKKVTEAIRQS